MDGKEWGEPLRECMGCGAASGIGAKDPDCGLWYCKRCWEIWEEYSEHRGDGHGREESNELHVKERDETTHYERPGVRVPAQPS